jgi:glutamine amidotransferase
VCRHLAYLGPPVALRDALCDAPHSLARQAAACRLMIVGDCNPDGWGVAWYPEPGRAPSLRRSTTALHATDAATFAGLAAGAFVAAVRLASPGTSIDARNNAPLVAGDLAFSLNGFVFTDGREDALRAMVTEPVDGDADSHLLFALARAAVADGATAGEALRAVHHRVAPTPTMRANLLLADGETVAATTWRHSLFTRHVVTPAGAAVTVASEPLDDDPAWVAVPDASLVEATGGTVTVSPL